jgi:hypothetical protein
LTAGRLADAGAEHAAENRLVDLVGGEAGILDRGLRGGGAQLRTGEWAQGALKRADRGAAGGNDIDLFAHGMLDCLGSKEARPCTKPTSPLQAASARRNG